MNWPSVRLSDTACLRQHFFSDLWSERVERTDIDAAADDLFEVHKQTCQVVERCRAVEFGEKVDIALRTLIAACERAKEQEPGDAKLGVQMGHFLSQPGDDGVAIHSGIVVAAGVAREVGRPGVALTAAAALPANPRG